jgi:hypothetical protein
MDLNAFLAEIFCIESPVTDLTATDLAKIFKGTQLDLSWILESTRVLGLLYINRTCESLYGFQIPRSFAKEVLAPVAPQSQGFTINVATVLFNRFSSAIFKLTPQLPVSEHTALNYIKNISKTDAKRDLIKWLCRGCDVSPLPTSLTEAFKKQPPKQALDPFVHPVSGNMITEQPLPMSMIPYDMKATLVVHDCCMQRQLFSYQPVVILKDTGSLLVPLLQAIYESSEVPRKLILITIKSNNISLPTTDELKLTYLHYELESESDLVFLPSHTLQMVYYIGTPPCMFQYKHVVFMFDGDRQMETVSSAAIQIPFTEFPRQGLYVPLRGDIPIPVSIGIFKMLLNPKAQHWIYQRLADLLLKSYIPVVPPKSTPHCVMLVDNRANGLSILAVLLTLCNLDRTKWTPVVYTKAAHKDFYTKHIPGVIIHTHPLLEVDNFDIETCNTLMKDALFWNNLEGYDKCLIVQDDGMLIRKGLDDSEFMDYDYVGAPWRECPENQEVAELTKNGMVGNGGFCLRTVKACIDVTESSNSTKELLFNKRLQTIQEDVWFVKELAAKGYKVCPSEKAKSFSVEQVYNLNTFGFHKLWAYHTPEQVRNFFQEITKT